jgi:ribonucleoside-diphosphate reductase alpha chain
MTTGLRIPRRYTSEGADPYSTIEWARRDSRITNPDGSVVFEVLDAEVPASWSQVATDIVVSKYFRKAGVPQTDADGKPVLDGDGNPVLGSETSGRQVFDRLATTWRWWGEKHGYFASSEDAQAYEDEMKYMLANQIASPNSPQWFNTGLAHAYGITGTPQGFWYVDPETGEMTESPDSYTHPAPHACFPGGTLITTDDAKKNIEDVEVGDLVLTHRGRLQPVVGLMQRVVDEPLVRLVSESVSLVATANHPIRVRSQAGSGDSWKNATDVANGEFVVMGDDTIREVLLIESIPFNGTVYNFQVEEDESYVANGVVVHNCFINGVSDDLVNPGGIMDLWVREARLFKMGSGTGSNFSQIRAENETLSGGGKSSGVMGFLRIGDRAAGAIKSGGTTRRAAKMVILDLDHPDIEEFIDWKMHEEEKARILINHGGYAADFNGEAYATVSGQNSNNSVRVPNEFIEAVRNDDDWQLRERTNGKVRKTIKARDLWRKVAEAAWACADPGVQFDTIINEWHTSPAGGKIRATNPCFTGDTRIATDKGLIQFKDMVNRVTEGESFQVYTHDATGENPSETISLTTPTQVMITGKNQILRLEFSDGRVLRLTPNHRLWTANRGWVRADELTETDHVRLLDQEIDFGMASMAIPVSTEVISYLARKSSRKNPVQLPEKWTEDFAHYLGWLIGDGCLTAQTAVTVYGSKEEQQTVMFQHLDLLTQINGGIAPKPTKMGNGTYQLRLARLSFMRFLEALGVSTGLAGDKKVPWSIFEAPKPIVAAFLKGLYDADGCVRYGDTTRYVGLGSKSVELLQGVQQLLDTFGIHGSIYNLRASSKSVFTYTTKNGEQREYRGGAFSDLRIMGSDLERFWKSIGFWLSNKNDILEQVLFETTRYATRHWVKMRARTEDGWENTYNLTEPKNHSYLALGIIVSNCSEYVFLDNTACNLASINLVKFFDDDSNVFDTEGYEHAIRLWTITLEISVTMAHFPSSEIARGSYDYRTLGLGYANLGTLLMRMGLPYDSDAGRAVSGAITGILTGYSYATSAELSAAVGPFPRFADNREAMLRVIRNHRRAAYNVPQGEYEGLSHFVMGINSDFTPSNLLTAARQSWDLALDMGERHGFRNAQVTVIAPTGTIGLQMDCDTTGVEPDFSLVKFKKLAGGGYFKIVNQSVTPALENLGYADGQIEEIIRFIVGTSSLVGAPYINRESLMAKGFTDEDMAKIEATLPAVFELRHAFNPFVLGEATMQRLGFEVDEYATFEFDLLRALGFTGREILEATEWVCGQQTIEGAPHLKDEHLAVFDTANRNGRNGQRLIHHTGHIRMLAATQPFLSGAASKTINMPNEATIEDIEESYMLSYELGVKCMALYRDGSKASQPLSSSSDDSQSEDEPEEVTRAHELDKQILWGKIPVGMSPTQAYAQGMHPPRFLLPPRRGGYTQEAKIGGHKVYLRTGEYEDGTLGEVFIDLAKEGATLRGILSCFAIAVSKGLQFGVPLEEFVDTFTFQTFEPRGLVEGHPNIKMANSIVDYVFRALAVEYLKRDDLAQVPPVRDGELPEPASGLAVEAGIQLDLTDAVAEQHVAAVASAVRFLESRPVAPAEKRDSAMAMTAVKSKDVGTMAMQSALGEMMGDAPLCDTCGHITIRNGSCYKCLNCGNSLGCS